VASFSLERTEPIFTGHVFGVERRHLRMDGTAFDREVVTHQGAVAVLAVDDADRVVLLEQFRATVGKRILELPAGTLDVEGEDSASAARRELIEEAGLDATTITPLGRYLNTPGYSTQVTTLFLAEDLLQVERAPMGIEESDMDVHLVDLPSALGLIESGEIMDAVTVIGLERLARLRGA
jgi:ADP-ribose pyrophosphatase